VQLVWIALGGAVGALTRHGVNHAIGAHRFPWSTLAVNVSGSFALGALLFVAGDRGWPPAVTAAVGVGFLGAYTTFSTFSVEAFQLGRTDRVLAAALYLGLSVALGVLAAAAGHTVARLLGT
jgi:CrcB protein